MWREMGVVEHCLSAIGIQGQARRAGWFHVELDIAGDADLLGVNPRVVLQSVARFLAGSQNMIELRCGRAKTDSTVSRAVIGQNHQWALEAEAGLEYKRCPLCYDENIE